MNLRQTVQQHMALVRALRKSPAPLALGAPAPQDVKAEAGAQQQTACC